MFWMPAYAGMTGFRIAADFFNSVSVVTMWTVTV